MGLVLELNCKKIWNITNKNYYELKVGQVGPKPLKMDYIIVS